MKGLRGNRFFRNEMLPRAKMSLSPRGRVARTQHTRKTDAQFVQRRAVSPICHSLLTSKFQFPENTMPSYAFRKEERLRITVAEGTGVREAPWAVVVQNQQLHIKEDTIKTVCSVPPHDLSVFHQQPATVLSFVYVRLWILKNNRWNVFYT